jgi:pimeloyl-ACP methyl ester carboxylesterase
MKRVAVLITIVLCLQLVAATPVHSAPADAALVKELNFVFLHGAGGNACSLQLLEDAIMAQIPDYILQYEQANPGIKIRVDSLRRCYPNDVDIYTWATNIVDSLKQHFKNKKNLILIGHSMGGKTALYTVAHNIGDLADEVAMVVTINSPIKSLDGYYVAGGGAPLDYCRARWLLSDQGICNSVVYYDSSQDGRLVGSSKHWMAFTSSEGAPLSTQFDVGGVDALPRDMDDVLIPISAQYSYGADVIYYGEHGHSDLGNNDEVAQFIADKTLRYIFGGDIEFSVFNEGGSFEHRANWLPGTDSWEDVVGQVPAGSGTVRHTNESFFKWQAWEDVVGGCPPGSQRSSYQVHRTNRFPFLAGIKEARWLSSDNSADCRLYLRTWAAPRSTVQVDWAIFEQGLLPPDGQRDHYEVRIVTGTPLSSITAVSWLTDDPRDLRLRIASQAESPFRWFRAEWQVFIKEIRQKRVIDEIPAQLATSP